MAHHLGDTLVIIPLEDVTEVTYTDGRLQVLSAQGNVLTGGAQIGIGSFQRDLQFEAPQLFTEADAETFISRFAAINPLFDAYLATLRWSALFAKGIMLQLATCG